MKRFTNGIDAGGPIAGVETPAIGDNSKKGANTEFVQFAIDQRITVSTSDPPLGNPSNVKLWIKVDP